MVLYVSHPLERLARAWQRSSTHPTFPGWVDQLLSRPDSLPPVWQLCSVCSLEYDVIAKVRKRGHIQTPAYYLNEILEFALLI